MTPEQSRIILALNKTWNELTNGKDCLGKILPVLSEISTRAAKEEISLSQKDEAILSEKLSGFSQVLESICKKQSQRWLGLFTKNRANYSDELASVTKAWFNLECLVKEVYKFNMDNPEVLKNCVAGETTDSLNKKLERAIEKIGEKIAEIVARQEQENTAKIYSPGYTYANVIGANPVTPRTWGTVLKDVISKKQASEIMPKKLFPLTAEEEKEEYDQLAEEQLIQDFQFVEQFSEALQKNSRAIEWHKNDFSELEYEFIELYQVYFPYALSLSSGSHSEPSDPEMIELGKEIITYLSGRGFDINQMFLDYLDLCSEALSDAEQNISKATMGIMLFANAYRASVENILRKLNHLSFRFAQPKGSELHPVNEKIATILTQANALKSNNTAVCR